MHTLLPSALYVLSCACFPVLIFCAHNSLFIIPLLISLYLSLPRSEARSHLSPLHTARAHLHVARKIALGIKLVHRFHVPLGMDEWQTRGVILILKERETGEEEKKGEGEGIQ